MGHNAFDLEKRLIQFAVAIIDIAESLPGTRAGSHLANQLVRSGTSPALNYGEAQGAESRTDFVHKLKIIVKELRETMVSLQICEQIDSAASQNRLKESADECNQLIAIFVRSIQTARRKAERAS